VVEEVLLQAVWLHIVFVQHALVDNAQALLLLQELPDTGSHVVEPEVAFARQVQQHGLATDFLKQYLGGMTAVASIVGFISNTNELQSTQADIGPASLGKRGVRAKQAAWIEETLIHCACLSGNDRHGTSEGADRLRTVRPESRACRRASLGMLHFPGLKSLENGGPSLPTREAQ
jgi:hypothetical protein